MSWTTDNYPKDFVSALAAGWEVCASAGLQRWCSDRIYVRMSHRNQDFGSMPIDVLAPDWLTELAWEERRYERIELQRALRALTGLGDEKDRYPSVRRRGADK